MTDSTPTPTNEQRLTEVATARWDQWWHDYYDGQHRVVLLFEDGSVTSGLGGFTMDNALVSTENPGYSHFAPFVGWAVAKITRDGAEMVACSEWNTPELFAHRLRVIDAYYDELHAVCARVAAQGGRP